ncbi:MAG: serine hydrolase domain-containing protein [Bacteroidia bacterium]
MLIQTRILFTILLVFTGTLACKKESIPLIDQTAPSLTLQDLVYKYHKKHPELPGITVTIVTANNIANTAAAGYSDVQLKTPLTSFHKIGVASNTKMLTAVIILQLMEEGKLSLNDKISDYLQEPWVDSLNIQNGILLGGFVRIIDLLKHNSGISDYVDENFIINTEFSPNKAYTFEQLMRYAIYNGESHFIPGTPGKYNYSSTNYTLLGLIIERVTGDKYENVLRNRILNPANMKNSFLHSYEAVIPPLSNGYYGTNNIADDNLSWVWATGGLASHSFDMTRFLSYLLEGKFFKKTSTLQLMLNFSSDSEEEYGYQYGLGIMKFNFGNGFNPIGHIGSLHGYTSACYYLPEHHSYMFVGITTGGAHAYLFDLLGQAYRFQTQRMFPKPPLPKLGGKIHLGHW